MVLFGLLRILEVVHGGGGEVIMCLTIFYSFTVKKGKRQGQDREREGERDGFLCNQGSLVS